ncbi:MAG: ABC transporter ATP-binding protein/permease [Rhodospirillales bacterium]|nr:ABC transporter ATP-binding protein/permease [Rhodospirillales bacterium]
MRGLANAFRETWRLSRPYFGSEEKWFARVLLGIIIAANLLLVGINVWLNAWNQQFFNALQNKDWSAFIRLLFFYDTTKNGSFMPGFSELVVIYIVVAVARTYLRQWLQIRWRSWLTRKLMDEWLADRAYYRISLTGAATDNPDQRIADDLASFVGDTLALGLDLLSNIVSLGSFLAILWVLSGAITVFGVTIPGYLVWVALVYSVFGTWITHKIGKPLVQLNFQQQRYEADFRFALVRLRENTEGVALYAGEQEENQTLRQRFHSIAANWWAIMQRMKWLNTFIFGFNQIANIFPIVVVAPRYFFGKIPLGVLTRAADAFGQVQGSMSWFVGAYTSLASWRATVERLVGFHRAIVDARAAATAGLTAQQGAEGFAIRDGVIRLPDGRKLLDVPELAIRKGDSLLVTGASGSGKSTLFRALAGIWPFGEGRLERPAAHALFLPQRPYIPLGTLRHAITYPAAPGAHEEAEVLAALDDVGLGALAARLDDTENWALHLSGGEQQRLAIARALLARPDYLFLDEATSALDPEAEQDLYALIRTRLPDAAIVSIAHRPALAALHARQLVIQRAPGVGRTVEAGSA